MFYLNVVFFSLFLCIDRQTVTCQESSVKDLFVNIVSSRASYLKNASNLQLKKLLSTYKQRPQICKSVIKFVSPALSQLNYIEMCYVNNVSNMAV